MVFDGHLLSVLQIHHLAVNALLKSSQIDEMEGGSLFGNDYEIQSGSHVSETDFDETSSCAPAFRVLKQLIQRCISDAVASGNVFADALLQHLYRWLCRLRFLSLMWMVSSFHVISLLIILRMDISALCPSFMILLFIVFYTRYVAFQFAISLSTYMWSWFRRIFESISDCTIKFAWQQV